MDNQPVANALYFAEINEGVVTNPTETDYLIYPTKSSNPINYPEAQSYCFYCIDNSNFYEFTWENVLKYANIRQKIYFNEMRKAYLRILNEYCTGIFDKPIPVKNKYNERMPLPCIRSLKSRPTSGRVLSSDLSRTDSSRCNLLRCGLFFGNISEPIVKLETCTATLTGTEPDNWMSDADIIINGNTPNDALNFITQIREIHKRYFNRSLDDVFDIHLYGTVPSINIIIPTEQRKWSMLRMAVYLKDIILKDEKYDLYFKHLRDTYNTKNTWLDETSNQEQIFTNYETAVKNYSNSPNLAEDYSNTKLYENDSYLSVAAYIDVVYNDKKNLNKPKILLNSDQLIDSIYDNFGFIVQILVKSKNEDNENKMMAFIKIAKYILRIMNSISQNENLKKKIKVCQEEKCLLNKVGSFKKNYSINYTNYFKTYIQNYLYFNETSLYTPLSIPKLTILCSSINSISCNSSIINSPTSTNCNTPSSCRSGNSCTASSFSSKNHNNNLYNETDFKIYINEQDQIIKNLFERFILPLKDDILLEKLLQQANPQQQANPSKPQQAAGRNKKLRKIPDLLAYNFIIKVI